MLCTYLILNNLIATIFTLQRNKTKCAYHLICFSIKKNIDICNTKRHMIRNNWFVCWFIIKPDI